MCLACQGLCEEIMSHAVDFRPMHGGNPWYASCVSGLRPSDYLDASASVVPFGQLARLPALFSALGYLAVYPDPAATELRCALGALHGIDPDYVLLGNGASELLTWAARESSLHGAVALPRPYFADYLRSLRCWGARPVFYDLLADDGSLIPANGIAFPPASVLWINNPHNPTGAIWDLAFLKSLLPRYSLVVCDEAFLPLSPGGECNSLLSCVREYQNLIVVRSLTKLFGVPGVRIGYAVSAPRRLQTWAGWRDPWPVNCFASAVALSAIERPSVYHHWCARVHRWVSAEARWLETSLNPLEQLTIYPSSANYVLIRSPLDLSHLADLLRDRRRILLRKCDNFEGLGPQYLRIGFRSRPQNRRIAQSICQLLPFVQPLSEQRFG